MPLSAPLSNLNSSTYSVDLLIEHHSVYRYSAPVFLEPHYLYFYPLTRPHFNLTSFELKITPSPEGFTNRLDAEDNVYHQCWFIDKIEHLEIKAVSKITVSPLNPFNFLVDFSRDSSQQEALGIYLKVQYDLSRQLTEWFNQIRNAHQNDIIGFLSALCRAVGAGWEHTIRYGEHLIDPNHCFESKVGSCRDLAWMMIQVLRTLDLPSRFVSGYCFNPELSGHELHAWVEVWVLGAGWVGIDPTAGLFVTGEYIPVSTSFHPAHTLPVQGSFRGNASSQLDTSVDIHLLE